MWAGRWEQFRGKAIRKIAARQLEQTLSCSEASLDSDYYLSLPEDVRSGKWKVAGQRYRYE